MAINLGYESQKFAQGTKEFFSSNSLVAKLVFLILVIIIFIILLRGGTALLSWIFAPSPDPTLIKGLKDAKKLYRIPQDPKKSEAIPILRSNDQFNGIEFTWSVWINIDDPAYQQYRYKHIFHKGNTTVGTDGIVEPTNGPGLYISPTNYPNMAELTLLLRMNIFTNENDPNNLSQPNYTCLNVLQANQTAPTNKTGPCQPGDSNYKQCMQTLIKECQKEYPQLIQHHPSAAKAPKIYDDIEIPDIPVNKWVNIIIRCSYNNLIDIYINGRLTRRHTLSGVARQNYGDVFVNLNGGFSGEISCLKYYNYALGTAKINSIVSEGPCLMSVDAQFGKGSKPYYLANEWYYDETDDLYSSRQFT